MRTACCIGCGGKPTHWRGHVHHGDIPIDASWCDGCAATVTKLQMALRRGLPRDCKRWVECQGSWLEADGVVEQLREAK